VKVLAAPVDSLHVRPLLVAFAGGDDGRWAVERLDPVVGAPLEPVPKLEVIEGAPPRAFGSSPAWVLRGVTSNERYVSRSEHDTLVAKQEALGREDSTRAALIPITKTDAWWELPQDERRRIFEERSRHVATGIDYLPAVARRLHHGRDLGELFDFLTWFKFAPEDAAAFEDLVRRLRETEEWTYVEREIDIRLARHPERQA
jgi:chlorite dismutase